MFSFKKKEKETVPAKEQAYVVYNMYTNQSVSRNTIKVFSGTVNDCRKYVRAQAIEAKSVLTSFEDEVIPNIYVSDDGDWIRVEVLDLDPTTENKLVKYFSSTYEVL